MGRLALKFVTRAVGSAAAPEVAVHGGPRRGAPPEERGGRRRPATGLPGGRQRGGDAKAGSPRTGMQCPRADSSTSAHQEPTTAARGGQRGAAKPWSWPAAGNLDQVLQRRGHGGG